MSGERVLLLVSGARTLADDAFAELWAQARLWEAIQPLPPGSHVAAGDARGPDAWAIRHARYLGLARSVFALDGTVRMWRASAAPGATSDPPPDETRRWATEAEVAALRADPRPSALPLARNAAMAETCAKAIGRPGWTVRVCALHDAASPTRGTAHAVGRAKEAGIKDADEHTWDEPKDSPSPKATREPAAAATSTKRRRR